MFYINLLIDLILTGFINLTPALIIRFLICKKRYEKKSYAIITSIIIAIVAWTIAYVLLFLNGADRSLPSGTAEILYAYINYCILKPTLREDNDGSDAVSFKTDDDSVSKETAYPKVPKLAKLSMAVNVVLCVSLVVSISFCFSLNKKVNTLTESLDKANEKYELAVNSRNSMQQRYEAEIEDLYKKNNPSQLNLDKELEEIRKENLEEIEEWNENNPNNQIESQ